MFKVIKDNKIIGISENYPVLLDDYEIIEDIEHTCEDYKRYGEEFTLIDIDKENEIAKQNRERAYANEVDPITAHIQRLKDENPVPEGEIAELIAERDAKVEEIKERFPYQEE